MSSLPPKLNTRSDYHGHLALHSVFAMFCPWRLSAYTCASLLDALLLFVEGQEVLSVLLNSSPLFHLSSRPHGLFSHEYGRRVGMVPRSSLKGGKVSRMVEKKTRTTNNKKTNRTQNQKGPQAASPPSCSLSSVLGETGETRKSVKKGLN